MLKIKEKAKSVRFRLFITMCIVISIIVICLIVANNVVLETFYLYSKTNTVRQVYNKIDNYFPEYKENIKEICNNKEPSEVSYVNTSDIHNILKVFK